MVRPAQRKRAMSLEAALTEIALLARPAVEEVDRRLARLARQHGDEVYAAFLHLICHLSFAPEQARERWTTIVRHTQELIRTLGRPVDYRVGAADYFVSQEPQIMNPKVIDIGAYQATEESSMRDGLTGLYNFRFLQEAMLREIDRANRSNRPLSLCFLDIDFFKAFNDKFGHTAGNEALQRIAACLLEGVRAMDLVCRFGGEELTIVLPATDKASALRVAERLVHRIERLGLPSPSPPGVVTASAGVASFPEDASSPEDLLRAADAALFAAKSKGKNRVETFTRERRLHRREAREFVGTCTLENADPVYLLGLNVSPGGLFFEAPASLPKGGRVELVLVFPHEDRFGQVSCHARVVRCQPIEAERFGVGACFAHMQPEERDKLLRIAALLPKN